MQNKEIFIPFRTFDSWQHAQQYAEILEKKGIKYKLEEYDKNINPLSLSSEKEFQIKVRLDDFEKADESVLEEAKIDDLSPDYYLHEFTDDELIEILANPHEWGEIDRIIAPKLLIERGYNMDKLNNKNKINEYAEQLANEQKETEETVVKWKTGQIKKILSNILGWI